MSFGMEALNNPTYGDDEKTTTSVEVEVEVVEEAAEEAEEIAEAIEDVEDVAEESDAGAAGADTLDEVSEIVAEEGLQPGMAKILSAMGLEDLMISAGMESLDPQSRNEEAAKHVVAGCESMMKRWWDNVKKFFKALIARIKKLVTWIVSKFQSMETSVKKGLTRLGKLKTLDSKKVNDRNYSGLTYSEVTTVGYGADSAFTLAENILDEAKAKAETFGKSDTASAETYLKSVYTAYEDETYKKSADTKTGKHGLKDWDGAKAKALGERLVKLLSQTRTLKATESRMKQLEKEALAEIKSLEKSDVEKDKVTKGKKKVEYYRIAGSKSATIIAAGTRSVRSLYRTFMSVVSNLELCQKDD